jgi:hypothetical protein
VCPYNTILLLEIGVPVQEVQIGHDLPTLQFRTDASQERRINQENPGRFIDDVLLKLGDRLVACFLIQVGIGFDEQLGQFVGGEPRTVAAALAIRVEEVGQDAWILITILEQEQVMRAGGGQVNQRAELQQFDLDRNTQVTPLGINDFGLTAVVIGADQGLPSGSSRRPSPSTST